MNNFWISVLVLLSYSLYASGADCSTDVLKTIVDTCIEKPVKLCEDRIAGQGADRDTFILAVKFIKKHKQVMSLYKGRFGQNEVIRFKKLINFESVLPNFSEYSVKDINKNERLYVGKKGDQIRLLKIADVWKIDLDKSNLSASRGAGKTQQLRILLGFFHDLQQRLEQKQSLEAVEKATLLGLAGIFYYDIPPDRPEKEQFKKYLSQHATTPEEIQHKFSNIADKL